ncbi:MAG: nucleoside deaminase [Ginsengibacter sp.]
MAESDEYYMQHALKEARKAFDEEEVPVGAVIVMQDKIIARGYNQVEKLNDSTAHAEIIALTSAYNFLGSKYLPDATLYVTIEPCLMCAGALYWSKIGKVVYGANDEKQGALTLTLSPGRPETSYPVGHEKNTIRRALHPKTEIVSNICENECATLIQEFFKARR